MNNINNLKIYCPYLILIFFVIILSYFISSFILSINYFY